MSAQETAHKHLKELIEFMGNKSEDELHKDHGFNRQHVHLLQELKERKAKGKELHFSDGNCEMLNLIHKRLIRQKALSEKSE